MSQNTTEDQMKMCSKFQKRAQSWLMWFRWCLMIVHFAQVVHRLVWN